MPRAQDINPARPEHSPVRPPHAIAHSEHKPVKPVSAKPRPPDQPARNPYEIPMEERMKLYKEKYGAPVSGGNPDGKSSAVRGNAQPRAGDHKKPATQSRPRQQQPVPPSPSNEPRAKAEAGKKPGVLDRIKGIFSRKKKQHDARIKPSVKT
jgi:hypothetical protein